MWTDPIVADIHHIRADIVAKTGDSSHAITLEAKRLTQEVAKKFGMHWKSIKPAPYAEVSGAHPHRVSGRLEEK